MNGLTYIEGVTTITLDADACNGCGLCTKVCPHPVFAREKSKVEIVARDLCIECGACVMNCPEDALSVTPGVGCAAAILKVWITGAKPSCGCR